jgi:hypothetical protein
VIQGADIILLLGWGWARKRPDGMSDRGTKLVPVALESHNSRFHLHLSLANQEVERTTFCWSEDCPKLKTLRSYEELLMRSDGGYQHCEEGAAKSSQESSL